MMASGKRMLDPLVSAVLRDDVNAAKRLLQLGVDVDKTNRAGFPVVIIAVLNSNVKVLRFLLEEGADANKKGPA